MNEKQLDSGSPSLFPESVTGEGTSKPTSPQTRTPRLRLPQRDQGEMFMESLDQRIEADHPVRAVWDFVEQLDLSSLLNRIQAVHFLEQTTDLVDRDRGKKTLKVFLEAVAAFKAIIGMEPINFIGAKIRDISRQMGSRQHLCAITSEDADKPPLDIFNFSIQKPVCLQGVQDLMGAAYAHK